MLSCLRAGAWWWHVVARFQTGAGQWRSSVPVPDQSARMAGGGDRAFGPRSFPCQAGLAPSLPGLSGQEVLVRRCRALSVSGGPGTCSAECFPGLVVPGRRLRQGPGARMLDHFLSDPWVLPLLLSDCPVAGSSGESGQRTMGSLWLKIWIQLGTELWTSWLCIRSRELSGMTLMGSRIWFRRRHSSRPMSEKSTRMVR